MPQVQKWEPETLIKNKRKTGINTLAHVYLHAYLCSIIIKINKTLILTNLKHKNMTTITELREKLNDDSIYVDAESYNEESNTYNVYRVIGKDNRSKEIECIALCETDCETIAVQSNI